jgi:hypothetical protein
MPNMSNAGRAFLAVVTFLGAFVFSWLVLRLFLPFGGIEWLGNLLALVIAGVAARYAWVGAEHGLPRSGYAGIGAVTLGVTGFVLGFFGPMLLAPDANQGPMLGIFITGPGGALLGVVLGWLYGVKQGAQ